MNEKDLGYFCAVYEEGSISQAAGKVYITPQGLSKAVHRLEEELGVSLFTRTSSGIRPTAYGEVLYKNAQEIMEELKQIKENVLKDGERRQRQLTAAFTLGVIDYAGVGFIRDFQKQYPQTQLSIIQNPDVRVDDMLRSDAAEIGVLAGPIDTTVYEAVCFTRHRHCLVVNREHPLAKKKVLTYADLDGQAIALEGREFRPFHNNMNRFLRNHVKPSWILETTEIESTHRFAALNNGIGLSVDFCAHSHPYENTVILPLADEDFTWETYLVYKKDRILSANARLFCKYALNWMEEHRKELFHWNPFAL